MGAFDYMLQNSAQIWTLLMDHIRLTAIAVALAIAVGVPLGILISYAGWLNRPIMGFANLIQAVPSMALLGFSIPLLGIGVLPAVVVVFLYSLLPIVKNTYTGITQIKPEMIEAARGIGMTSMQVLRQVRIPLTLPILMAGVRISAVTAVGLMTIAAYIGAGGLGFLVFSGISSVNTGMIMAGAIPACLLALIIDWVLSLVEDLVTPVSLQVDGLKNRAKTLRTRKYKKLFIGLLSALLIITLAMNAYSWVTRDRNVIRIGSKSFSEQLILGNMMKEIIEKNTDLKVEARLGAGTTQILFGALQSKDMDLYIDYTGTVYVDILKNAPVSDAELVYQTGKKEMAERYGITMLEPMNLNNTYALAVDQNTMERDNLRKMSDLSRVGSSLSAALTLPFLQRADGLKGIEQVYGFNFKNVIAMDGANRYLAMQNGQAQILDAFATDGLLKKFNLYVLEDDKHFFPPYYGVPLIRTETLEQHPELGPLLNELGSRLDNETMQELNYQVDEGNRAPTEVAHEFLVKEGLVKQ